MPRRSARTASRSVDDLLAAEQVVDAQVAHVAELTLPPTSSAGVGRTFSARPAVAAAVRQQRDDSAARRDGQDHLLHVLLRGDPRDVPQRAEDLDAVDLPPELARVVVEQADRRQAGERVVRACLHQRGAGLAGAEDEHAHAGRAGDERRRWANSRDWKRSGPCTPVLITMARTTMAPGIPPSLT